MQKFEKGPSENIQGSGSASLPVEQVSDEALIRAIAEERPGHWRSSINATHAFSTL